MPQIPNQKSDKKHNIFIKTNDERTIYFNVFPSDTIKYVKRQIQERICVPIEQQNLIYTGKKLDDDKSISDYDLMDETIHLSIKYTTISVKTRFDGKTVFLDVFPSNTIKSIKRNIQQIFSIPLEEQRLIFQDKPLDDDRTISDYELKEENTLYLERVQSS